MTWRTLLAYAADREPAALYPQEITEPAERGWWDRVKAWWGR